KELDSCIFLRFRTSFICVWKTALEMIYAIESFKDPVYISGLEIITGVDGSVECSFVLDRFYIKS
ncbi:hypothetical protein KKC59_02555, partial [bacterium]|nr:hypothetical protein [bacterium]